MTDHVQAAATTSTVHQAGDRVRQPTVRRGVVTSVDPTNRVADVGTVGPDSVPHPADVAGGVTLWPGDVVDVMYLPPHGAVIIGRVQGDYEDWHIIGDTGEPPFGTGWQAASGTGPPTFPGPAEPMYTRRSGRVELRGQADRVSGSGQLLVTLPEPYWPDNDLLVPALTALGAHEPLTISRDGDIRTSGSGIAFLVLDGVSYLARAPRDLEV